MKIMTFSFKGMIGNVPVKCNFEDDIIPSFPDKVNIDTLRNK